MKLGLLKHTFFVGIVSLLALALELSALATPPGKSSHLVHEPVIPESTSSSSERSYGVGFAAVEHLTGTPTALTGVYQFDSYNLIQAFFAIESTSPIGRFNVAGLYKHSIIQGENAGLHIGFGLGAGNVETDHGGEFAFAMVAVGGIHLSVPGLSNVKIHLDGGPQFSIIDSNSSFAIRALSPALGLSLYYQL